jgi:hypothetical protein
MSTYKVIQDIEAEDKLVGPFSFRQFVYLLIAAFLGYLSFICIAKGVYFLLVLFVPPMLFCMFFAWPWTPDQPTEVWALARIRFLVKSRKRIWDQSGIKEFVTITVPKKVERNYTDGLSQHEVRSRLHALANTIDSRGWAVKNAGLNQGIAQAQPARSDRLIDFSAMPQQVSDVDVRAEEDILDEANNPVAYHMSAMINASTQARRQELVERMNAPASAPVAEPQKQWFTAQPGALPTVMQAQPAAVQVQDQLTLPPKPQSANTHLKNINPAGNTDPVQAVQQQQAPIAQQPAPAPVQAQPNPAILNLAQNNNLDIATLAREAKRAGELDDRDGEVVVSLR